jgi:hypothetical protein
MRWLLKVGGLHGCCECNLNIYSSKALSYLHKNLIVYRVCSWLLRAYRNLLYLEL